MAIRGEEELLMRLRAGDEATFSHLVDMYHPAMIRLALLHVRRRAVAEEVAQEAWLGLLRGIDRFEGRSSLRTWLFRIVINRAISTGIRENVHLPVDDDELEKNDGKFSQDGWWVTPPTHWADEVLDRIAASGLAARVQAVIAKLPPQQRSVVTLRDVDGLTPAEAWFSIYPKSTSGCNCTRPAPASARCWNRRFCREAASAAPAVWARHELSAGRVARGRLPRWRSAAGRP